MSRRSVCLAAIAAAALGWHGAVAQRTDAYADFMTTPSFPAVNTPPTIPGSTPGDGLHLSPGSKPVMNLVFPGAPGVTPTIPDETALRQFVYLNYLVGNQTAPARDHVNETGQGGTAFWAVARHYPVGSPHSTTPVMHDGLHVRAFCSANGTACGPGQIYGGMIRFPVPIRPGMVVKLRYRAAPGAHAWVANWLYSGEQLTPGPGQDPYGVAHGIQTCPAGHCFEIDLNGNYNLNPDVGGPSSVAYPPGNQIIFNLPDRFGVTWPAGAPAITYAATDGAPWAAQPNNGFPFVIALPGSPLYPDWTHHFHDVVLNWREDGKHLDLLFDGRIVYQGTLDYAATHSDNAHGEPLGLHLIISNQAVPTFQGVTDVRDNDGITTPGAEGWTAVYQEVSVWKGTIAGIDTCCGGPRAVARNDLAAGQHTAATNAGSR